MTYFIISKKNLNASVWDGGKTFEYFIYPPEATYAKRDFLFRISTATIEKTPSNFTQFENYQRFLVMLDNDLNIQRNGKKERYKKEEVFSFDSNDEIISQTLGNDFNLMIDKERLSAKVFFLNAEIQSKHSIIFLFSLTDVRIKINNKRVDLKKDDLILIENKDQLEVLIKAEAPILAGTLNL